MGRLWKKWLLCELNTRKYLGCRRCARKRETSRILKGGEILLVLRVGGEDQRPVMASRCSG